MAVAALQYKLSSRATTRVTSCGCHLPPLGVGTFVQADQRAIGIVWPQIDGQYAFHGGYEGAVGIRWDDPAPPAVGFEAVFLSARPIVESLAWSTVPSSTTLFSDSRDVQGTRPLGGLEQASAISLASFSPSKMRGTAGVARFLRLKTAANPTSTKCLCFTSALHHRG
jgi:hypothetical protein